MDAANPKPSNTAFVGLVAAMAEVIANNDGESPWGFCPACNGMPLYGEPRCLMCQVEKQAEISAELLAFAKAYLDWSGRAEGCEHGALHTKCLSCDARAAIAKAEAVKP